MITGFQKKKDATHIYPIYHTNKQILFSSKASFFSKYKKILISQSSKFYPFYDDSMGFTQNVSAIIVSSKKEGDHIIKLLNSKLFSFFLTCIRYSTNITIYYLNFFPYPKDIPYDFTDEDLYKYFKLTQNEIDYVIEPNNKVYEKEKSGGSIKYTNNKTNNKPNKPNNKPKTHKFKGKQSKNTTINKKKINRKINRKIKTTIKKNKGFS